MKSPQSSVLSLQSRNQKATIRFEVQPCFIYGARLKWIAAFWFQLGHSPALVHPTCTENVGFRTGHQNTRLSRAFDLYAFPPSQNPLIGFRLLKGGSVRLNEAIKPSFVQKFTALEVSHA